jgi:hypothetical protein
MTLTRVIADGFHPDSLVYMSMARNLAEGHTSFWSLHFTDNLFNEFYEHPPLGIYLMSLCFSLFGDTILIDKFYGPFLGLLMMFEMMAIYRLVSPGNYKNGMLLGAFYFVMFPIVSNTLENNLLEVPAALFALGSVYIFLKGVLQKRNSLLYALLFSLALLAAFLSKGPVALFPFALPFFYFILFSKEYKFTKMLLAYGYIVLFLLLFSLVLYTYAPSNHYFTMYIDKQILASISGARGEGEHFKLLSQLLIDFSSIFLVSLIALFAGKVKPMDIGFSKIVFLFVLIGLSASLPLEISPKQHDYYIFPSLPYFALALGLVFSSALTTLLKKAGGYKLFLVLNTVAMVALIFIFVQSVGSYKRHASFYHDFVEAKVDLVKHSSVNVCTDNSKDYQEFFNNTEITGNLERFYQVRLYDHNNSSAEYFLTTLSSLNSCKVDDKKYKYIGVKEPKEYLLYRAIF